MDAMSVREVIRAIARAENAPGSVPMRSLRLIAGLLLTSP
jgi:hypothetical protein